MTKRRAPTGAGKSASFVKARNDRSAIGDIADLNDGHVASRDPKSGRTHPWSPRKLSRPEIELLRDLAEEFCFWPAITDSEDIERRRRHNEATDFWLASSRRFDH